MEGSPQKVSESPFDNDADKSLRRRRPRAFWDTLSQVPFCPSALREFNRRVGDKSGRYSVFKRPVSRRIATRSYRRRLVEYAMAGGPDLSGLRGFADHVNQGSSVGDSRSRSGKKKTTTHNKAFEQAMIDGGVYPAGYEGHGCGTRVPVNLDEILNRLRHRRASLPDASVLADDFREQSAQETSETLTIAAVYPSLWGKENKKQHFKAGERPFTDMCELVRDVSVLKPDLFYGSYLQNIDKGVRRDLGKYIIPGGRPGIPMAPNFFLEAKCEEARGGVAKRQAMYDGAVGARAMFSLQNYQAMCDGTVGARPVFCLEEHSPKTLSFDGKAYTLTCTYSQGNLAIYATHPVWEAKNRRITYHMTRLRSISMFDTVQSYHDAITAYRNARDWSKEQRDALVTKGNTVASRLQEPSIPQEIASDLPTAAAIGINGGGGEPSTSFVPQDAGGELSTALTSGIHSGDEHVRRLTRSGKRLRQVEPAIDVAPMKRREGRVPAQNS